MLPFITQYGTIVQVGFPCCRIVIAAFGINMIGIAHNIRRAYNVGHLCRRVITQGVRCQRKLRIDQPYIIIEHRLLGAGIILPPFRGQHILFIHQRPSVEEVAQIIYPVIVQTIGKQCRGTVLHTHIHTHLRYLGHAVIIQMVTVKKKRIPLLHPHIAESLERTDLVVIIGTVAIHIYTVMAEDHIAYHHLRVGMPRIFTEQVGMQQINLAFLFRLSALPH